MLRLQPQLLFQQDDRAELRSVVLNVEAVMLAFDDSVTATNTDVVDSHLTLVSATQLELGLLGRHREQVNVPRRVLVQRHRLQQYVIVFDIHLLRQVNDLVYRPADFESIWVHLFADFTFETLPVKRAYVLVLGIWWFFLFLSENPILETLEVDETDSTLALASDNERIVGVLLGTPANSALNLVLVAVVAEILNSLDFLSFFEFLVVKLTFTHRNLITLEVLHSKANSTQFNSVKFLNLVIVFSSFIFE